MTTIYAKTRKGQDEIDHRAAGLHPRARRLLILIDGRRASDELATLLGDASFDQTLAALAEQGFIEALGVADEPPPAETPAEEADPDEPQDPKQLEMARNFMLNTLRTFNGPYGKIGLMTRIHGSAGRRELRQLAEEWYQSICETRMGKLRAEELRGRLLSVL